VRAEIIVDLPHPRDDSDPKFRKLVDDIYGLMTTPEVEKVAKPAVEFLTIDLSYRLAKVEISEMMGLIEELASHKGKIDLPLVAEELHFEIDELFPITEALEIMHFAIVREGDIELTDLGRKLAAADILERKKIFAKQLLDHVPMARYIRQVLDKKSSHEASEELFLKELEKHLSEQAAEEVLEVVIDWGRYAEIFAYDYNSGILSLEDPQ